MSNRMRLLAVSAFALSVLIFLAVPALAALDSVATPKEFGVYAKTDKGTKRIIPNMVSDDQGVYYLEPNKPQTFALGTIEYFIIYGKYQMEYLTLNPMKPYRPSPLGINRAMFGREMDLTVTRRAENLYTIKPKGLFGRGYYALWIEDTAWDFLIE